MTTTFTVFSSRASRCRHRLPPTPRRTLRGRRLLIELLEDRRPLSVSFSPMIDLGALGLNSCAYAINDSGQVVGKAETASGAYHAFLYSNGTTTDLGTQVGSSSFAHGINNSGELVGYTNLWGPYHAFLYSDGTMTDLGTLGGSSSHANGINNNGQVVGYATITDGLAHAFLYSNGTLTDLGTLDGGYVSYAYAINESGQIVGHASASPDTPHAFLYSNGEMTDLGTLGGSRSFARGINDSGQVVGYAETASGTTHAFLYSNGTMTDLGTLGGGFSEAYGINDSGQVVGEARTAGSDHAFLLHVKVDTSISVDTSAFRSVFGDAVTFQATVISTEPHAAIPTGTVTFKDRETTLGSIPLSTSNGVTSAVFTTKTLAVGAHTVTAAYSGDDTFTRSESLLSAAVSVVTPAEDVNLSSNHLLEQSPLGTVVGTLITPGSQSGDVFTYSLVPGDGDVDNISFTIAGDALKTATVPDYETKPFYSIRVRATYGQGLSFEKALTVEVENLPPAVAFSQAAGQFDPASSLPIHFTVVFSEPVTGLTSEDFAVTGDAAGTPLVTVTGGGQTYDVAINGVTNTGSVRVTLRGGAGQDGAGVPSSSPLVIDDTVLYRPWTNQRKPADLAADAEFSPYVTPNDADVSANDVLAIINFINQNDSGPLPPPPASGAPAFYDVDADGSATPLDALLVINYINTHSIAAGEAETEPSADDWATAASRPAQMVKQMHFGQKAPWAGLPIDNAIQADQPDVKLVRKTNVDDAVFATWSKSQTLPLPPIMPSPIAMRSRLRVPCAQTADGAMPRSFSDAVDGLFTAWGTDFAVF